MYKFKRNKKVKNATECTYEGIKFKSKLELVCYKWLKLYDLKFEYEKLKIELIPSFKPNIPLYEFNAKKGILNENLKITRTCTYTPDFIVKTSKGLILLETKGFETDSFKLKFKMLRAKLQGQLDLPIIGLFLVKNQRQIKECIEIIKSKYI
jgi:hypothetical protein